MAFAVNQGVRIHFEVEGEGPPLVLHHGLCESLAGWREYGYVEALKPYFRLVLLDGRGHGRSDKPTDPAAYGLARRVSDVTAVLDGLGIGRAHFLGYSLGGWIGFGMARHSPERLLSLVLGGAHPYAEEMGPFREILVNDLGAVVEFFDRRMGPLSASFRQRILQNDMSALRASVSEDRPDLAPHLHRLPAPTLLFAGAADPRSYAIQRFADAAAGLTTCILPGLNHFQAYKRSDLVLPVIRGFLAQVCQEGSGPAEASSA